MHNAKRLIIFSFEGKNNKTETIYFRHFKPKDGNFVLKTFSSGCTDIKNMINSSRRKASNLGFTSKDYLYIFVDTDLDSKKIQLIEHYKTTLPKNIKLIVSNPCFEIWLINHFSKFDRPIHSNDDLLSSLKEFLPNYQKNKDYHHILLPKLSTAIANTKNISSSLNQYYSEVIDLFINDILIEK